jgi:hypothetical protein
MDFSRMNMLGLPSNVRFAYIACYWKFFRLHYIQVLCKYRLYRADYVYLTCLMLQRQFTHLNGRKLDHRQWISTSLYSLVTDTLENRSIAQQQIFYCCHALLSGQVFAAWCIAPSTARIHREHCLYCCVFIATCLLRRCLAKWFVRHSVYGVLCGILNCFCWFYEDGYCLLLRIRNEVGWTAGRKLRYAPADKSHSGVCWKRARNAASRATLLDGRSRYGSLIPGRGKIYFHLHSARTPLGPTHLSIQLLLRALSLG